MVSAILHAALIYGSNLQHGALDFPQVAMIVSLIPLHGKDTLYSRRFRIRLGVPADHSEVTGLHWNGTFDS